ncbi:MAG: 2-phospho-L-lactate guanylyltransferase [Mycobacteriales bacterium]
MPTGWSVVVPLKALAQAKSRLYADGSVTADHDELVLALALDTVTAALAARAASRVVVVTDDQRASAALLRIGAIVIADGPGAGLNPALEYGASTARSLAPLDGIAVLPSDLPALRPIELDAALRAAAAPRAFVADADGIGTTLLTAQPGTPLDPRYGNGSRAAHAAGGAVELTGDWPSLRRDVDTPAALHDAVELHVGEVTRAILAAGRHPTFT